MYEARWYIQSRLSETEMNVTFIYLFMFRMEVSSLRLKAFHNMGVVSLGDRACLLTAELYLHDATVFIASFFFFSGQILPRAL